MKKRLFSTKTFWTALTGIVTAVGAYMAGEIALEPMLNAVWTGVMVIFVRDGIAKS